MSKICIILSCFEFLLIKTTVILYDFPELVWYLLILIYFQKSFVMEMARINHLKNSVSLIWLFPNFQLFVILFH